MDFVADQLFDGRRLRALTLVDIYMRECLAIEVAAGLRGVDVVRVIDAVTMPRGAPQSLRVDNGLEFISKVTSVPTLFEQIQLVSRKGPKVIGNDFVK